MARYSLKLPDQLKSRAEEFASSQGISLNQFILWAVAEKVGDLRSCLDDPEYPHIVYRRSVQGAPVSVMRESGIRVKTIVIAYKVWQLTQEQIADEYGLSTSQVREALAFYEKHAGEVDFAIESEEQREESDD